MELDPKTTPEEQELLPRPIAKSRRGGRRVPGPGKKLGRPRASIASILANLPEERKKAFLRSVQEAVERTIKKILSGEKLEVDEATTLLTETGQVDAAPQGQTGEHASPATPGIASTSPSDRSGRKVPVEGDEPTTLLTEAGQVDAAPQGRAGEHASPATPGVASTSPSGRGGRRVPGPGKKLGRPPSRFTVDGICRRFPQSAERLHRDIVRLAAEEVARRLAWIIHEVSSQKRKDALKGMMNTGFARPAFPFGASIA